MQLPRVLTLMACLVVHGVAGAQAGTRTLTIVRADRSSVELSQAALTALPRTTLRATAHEKTSTFDGIELRVVLVAGGAGPVDSLKGPLLHRVLTVVAADGYRVTLPLSELDATIGNARILLADREDGAPLSATDGPWRLIVPGDARPARWARMVIRIEVTDVP